MIAARAVDAARTRNVQMLLELREIRDASGRCLDAKRSHAGCTAVTAMRSSWMLAQLDFATRTHHMAADAGRMALLGEPINRERYEDYLQRTYAFEAPIETRWIRTEGLESVIDLKPRLRTGFLVSDIAALNLRPEPVPPASFVGVEQALGWMYVVERGRRMNALLHRHLTRRMPAVLTIAGNFLNASSPCGMRWQQFGDSLDRFAVNHVIADQIVNAANRAFRSIRHAPRSSRQGHAA